MSRFKPSRTVLLSYEFDSLEVEEDGVDRVELRDDQTLREYKSGEEVGYLKLEFLLNNVRCLKIFNTYSPNYKYYLFLNGTDLVVVQKGTELKIHKKYRNVSEFDIADVYNMGKPLIVINFNDKRQALITDTYRDIKSNDPPVSHQPSGGVSMEILTQLSMMRTMAKTVEDLLQDKSCLIAKMSDKLAFNAKSDDDLLSSIDSMVCAYGEREMRASVQTTQVLSVGSHSVKFCSNKWILTFPVYNLVSRTCGKFEVFVSHPHLSVKETFLFTPAKPDESDYELVSTLNCSQKGFVVAILSELYFTEPEFKFDCVASFAMESSTDVKQIFLGEMCIYVENLANRKYEIDESNVSLIDIIALKATSQQTTVGVDIPIDTCFKLLIQHLHFTSFNNSSILNTSESVLKHALITVNDLSTNTVTIYTKDKQKLCILIQKFLALKEFNISFKNEALDIKSSLKSMKKELELVKNILLNELMGSSDDGSEGCHNQEVLLSQLKHLEIESACNVAKLVSSHVPSTSVKN